MHRWLSTRLLVVFFVVMDAVAWISPARTSTFPSCLIHGAGTPGLTTACAASPKGKYDLNLIMIDHYDSFTYNLADLLSQLCTTSPLVLAADCADSWEELVQQSKTFRNWTRIDGVVLSPGPGHPQTEGKLSRDVIAKNPDMPILGVCLGHQILGDVYGANVDLAPEPVHGQVRKVQLVQGGSSDPVWKGIEEPIDVTRYHSLHVTDLSEDIIPTAETVEEGLLMAMRHKEYPHFGLQFHPESIGTPLGKQLLANFCDIVQSRRVRVGGQYPVSRPTKELQSVPGRARIGKNKPRRKEVFIHKVETSLKIRPEDVMRDILKDSDFSFWLDGEVPDRVIDAPAVSILGNGSRRIEYWGKEKPEHQRGLYRWEHGVGDACERIPDMDVLTYLQHQYSVPTVEATMVSFGSDGAIAFDRQGEDTLRRSLPFSFRGGHVGFLGYEVRHDTARFLEDQERGRHGKTLDTSRCKSDPRVPTAAFLDVDKSYVFDQKCEEWYLVGVSSADTPDAKERIIDWMEKSANELKEWEQNAVNGVKRASTVDSDFLQEKNGIGTDKSPIFRPNQSRTTYNRSFDQCIENIWKGNSYELCLTNQFEAFVPSPGSTPLDLYRILRQRNPAPHSAYLNWNSEQRSATGTDAAFAICCSSPERFVSVSRKDANALDSLSDFELQVEAKPIKGTCARVLPKNEQFRTEAECAEDEARAKDLRESVKDRAENLMIVDLLRNDISRVCTPGTVHVAKLMGIESFATVHQMVSTIRGTLDPSKASALDILKACFPGGSMTGAPKLRTMEILDDIEEGVCRGPYSGSLGYISWNGSMDMNIIIRTAVLTPENNSDWNVSIGAGGAITALSREGDEYDEMVLKSSAVVRAVEEWTLRQWAFESRDTVEACTKKQLSR